MNNSEIFEKEKIIFGNIFLLANKLQIVMDEALISFEITTKQWVLMQVLEEFFSTPPTLSELSKTMGSSHQNVKQLILKLEKKGFLNIEIDELDNRTIRIKLSEKYYLFCEKSKEAGDKFITKLFEKIEVEKVQDMHDTISKLLHGISIM